MQRSIPSLLGARGWSFFTQENGVGDRQGSRTFGNGGHEAFLPPGSVAVRLLVVAVFPVVHLRWGKKKPTTVSLVGDVGGQITAAVLKCRLRLTSPFRESLLGDEDGPRAKAPAGSRSSAAAARRLRPGSLVGRRPGHTMSELRLRTSRSGKEWRCLVCSSSAWIRLWGAKSEWRGSWPKALASGMGGSGGG